LRTDAYHAGVPSISRHNPAGHLRALRLEVAREDLRAAGETATRHVGRRRVRLRVVRPLRCPRQGAFRQVATRNAAARPRWPLIGSDHGTKRFQMPRHVRSCPGAMRRTKARRVETFPTLSGEVRKGHVPKKISSLSLTTLDCPLMLGIPAAAFTMPWSATVTYQHAAGNWPESVCAENRDALQPTVTKRLWGRWRIAGFLSPMKPCGSEGGGPSCLVRVVFGRRTALL
jgi:hypothetical protein